MWDHGNMNGKNTAEFECGHCGNPIGSVAEVCPKCGGKGAVRRDRKKYLEVDVAHAGETVEKALAKLNQAASEALAGAYNVVDTLHAVRRAQAINSSIKSAGLKYITQYIKAEAPDRVYIDHTDIGPFYAKKEEFG